MNMKLSRTFFPLFILMAMLLISCQVNKEKAMAPEENNNLIVLVQYKAQPGRAGEALAGLTRLIDSVKEEPHFVSIRLHQNFTDDSSILLYEEWSDASYYNGDHMTTDHLKSFMIESRAFLAGPPEISQWKAGKNFLPGKNRSLD